MNKDQAVSATYRTELHYGQCKVILGKRGGETTKTEHWRVNGKCKTWKTRPEEFELPIKYGLKSCAYMNERNAGEFHLPEDCILLYVNADGSPLTLEQKRKYYPTAMAEIESRKAE